MRNLSTVLLGAALLVFGSCANDTLELKTEDLRVRFDKNTALLSVKDLRTSREWKQEGPAEFTVKEAKVSDGCIEASLSGVVPLDVKIRAEGASVKVRLYAPSQEAFEEFSYPAPFRTDRKDFYILETDGEGMLLPVTDTTYKRGEGMTFFCGGGLAMPWKGVVDNAFQTGYQVVLNTPFDARLEDFVQEDGLMSFKTVWMSSQGTLSYEREMVLNFFSEGGYVAQCKKYRDYVWGKGEVKTLKEHMERYPDIDGILAAPHIYVWDTGRDVSVLQEMKQAGIGKLFILWDSNHTPYPKPGYDNAIRSLGYCAGGYELFTDLHPSDSVYYDYDWNGPLRLKHGVYPGEFNRLAARKADGSTYSNQFGTYACPAAMQEKIRWKLDKVVKEYPHDGLFLDVYQANGLYECYNPEHPVTREGYAKAILENYKYIQDRYGFFLGGEWGADFAVPVSVFNHGMMTLQWPWWGSEIDDKESPYYYGDWKNHERPSIMLTTTKAGPTYYRWCLNEAIRVPLYELVYHDAVVSSWRWEDGNPRYPELWWKKDLFNMLYGSAPLWILDRTLWETYRDQYVDSYGTVCSWLSQIATDELTDHRFLTEDGKVQMSTFSSGKSIIVNFSDSAFTYEGQQVEPRGYVQVPAR